MQLRYVPFDLPGSVRRFFDRVQPRLAMILETEIWPNLYAECGRRGVPLVLASARISPRSVGSYRRLVPLFRQTLSHGIVIAAQSEADAERFRSIGASRRAHARHRQHQVRFPAARAASRRRAGAGATQNAPGRPVWVAGSTHEGEEAIVLDAHQPRARRVSGGAAGAGAAPSAALRCGARAAGKAPRACRLPLVAAAVRSAGEPAVLLGDTMGELMTFYAAADVAFVAGSLVPIGGHNLLEPASLGLPVLTGPHNFNGEEIARLLVEAGAARVVTDPAQLAHAVTGLFGDHANLRAVDGRGRQGGARREPRRARPPAQAGRAAARMTETRH